MALTESDFYVIWDIDNCLADDRHRLHFVDLTGHGPQRYAAYNARSLHDIPANQEMFRTMSAMATPVFFTGRQEYLRRDTTVWLSMHFGVWNPIMFMRPNEVGCSPRKLKEAMLHALWGHGVLYRQIIGAFDDVPAVIDMYRSYGLPAAQLAIHDELHLVYSPNDLR